MIIFFIFASVFINMEIIRLLVMPGLKKSNNNKSKNPP